ncbi:MAG: hypothetical protein A2W08_14475 [Candidatus Rokubacteria bacterium RBG_16_73_20]|nr:MAG: hypothetical protein A2W08_14475 [Candidatus Rokubacteria bacterium RBG_16_73_20]
MDELALGEESQADQDLAELLAGALLLGEHAVELLLGDEPVGQDEVPEPAPDGPLRGRASVEGGDLRACVLGGPVLAAPRLEQPPDLSRPCGSHDLARA